MLTSVILVLNFDGREYETFVTDLQFQGKYQSLLKKKLFQKMIYFSHRYIFQMTGKNTK